MSEPEGSEHASLLERFPALQKLGVGRGRRRIPVIQQVSATECGAVCLAMTLAYFGKTVSVDQIRNSLGLGRDGASALALLEAARQFGLRGRGVKVDLDELELLDPGTILHWEFAHYVVFERVRRDGVEIVDPAFGQRRLTLEEFGKSFTGVALLLEPGPELRPTDTPANPLWAYFRQLLEHQDVLIRLVVTSVLLQLLALAVPSLTGAVVDRVVPRNDYHLLTVLAVGLTVVTVFDFMSSMVRSHLLLHLRTHLDARMTFGFLDHLVDLPYPFFQLRSAGDLMTRLNSNATIREVLTSGALSSLIDGLFVFLYLLLLFIASPTMGALVFALGVLQSLIFLFTRRRQKELTSKTLQVDAICRNYEVELLTGIETLKSMGVERRAVEHFSNLYVDLLNVTLERGQLTATADAFSGTLRLASPLVILGVGALLVMDNTISLGTMLALNALAAGFLTPLAGLVSTASQLQLLGSYFERVQDVMQTPPEQDPASSRTAPHLRGAIALENVSFRYAQGSELVVQDISVAIRPGQMVAIVGGSGAGKSTVANLLVGLYLPTSGRILYDGVPLSELDLTAVRRQLGIVMQSPVLFGGSIRQNITLSTPGASLEDVMNAARMARIHDEIMAMPMQYESLVADRGASLSGGQRQRIALARALIRNPAILLLDEATSALDAVTESRVLESLTTLDATRIVIAHRLSTVKSADLILVLDQGRLVESGTHEELLALRRHYAALVAAQRDNPASARTTRTPIPDSSQP